MHTIKPLDIEMLDNVMKTHSLLVTIEEHNIFGGLGSAIAEYISDKKERLPLLKIGVNDRFPSAGDYHYQLEETGLTAEQISTKIKKFIYNEK